MVHPSFDEYKKAMSEYDKRTNRELLFILPHIILIIALVVIGLVLISKADKSPVMNSDGVYEKPFAAIILIPHWIGTGLYLVFFLVIAGIFFMRCPSCRKFFSRGKLELYDTVQNTSTDSEGRTMVSTKRIYITNCKSCGSLLWVIRG